MSGSQVSLHSILLCIVCFFFYLLKKTLTCLTFLFTSSMPLICISLQSFILLSCLDFQDNLWPVEANDIFRNTSLIFLALFCLPVRQLMFGITYGTCTAVSTYLYLSFTIPATVVFCCKRQYPCDGASPGLRGKLCTSIHLCA